MTLTANWKEVLKVDFDSNGGSRINSLNVLEGDKADEPNDPVREGYTFNSWTLNGRKYNFNSSVNSDITLVAKWDKIPEVYYVEFKPNNGSLSTTVSVNENQTVKAPRTPVREGYDFNGWLLNGNKYNFSTRVTKNIVLEASWVEKKVIVTFNYGTSSNNMSIKPGTTVLEPEIPVMEGFNFIGWYLNGEKFDFNTNINENIELVANWEEITTQVSE